VTAVIGIIVAAVALVLFLPLFRELVLLVLIVIAVDNCWHLS
jgi:hypothetical protein